MAEHAPGAGLQRVERARSNAEAHGTGRGQDREAVDQSGIDPGHVEEPFEASRRAFPGAAVRFCKVIIKFPIE